MSEEEHQTFIIKAAKKEAIKKVKIDLSLIPTVRFFQD